MHTDAVRRAAAAVRRIQSIVSASWRSGRVPKPPGTSSRSMRGASWNEWRGTRTMPPVAVTGSFVFATVKTSKRALVLGAGATRPPARAARARARRTGPPRRGRRRRRRAGRRRSSAPSRPLPQTRRRACRVQRSSHARLARLRSSRPAVREAGPEALVPLERPAVARLGHGERPVRVVDQPPLDLPHVALGQPPVVGARARAGRRPRSP